MHHGNGTEAAFESDPGVLFISSHQSSEPSRAQHGGRRGCLPALHGSNRPPAQRRLLASRSSHMRPPCPLLPLCSPFCSPPLQTRIHTPVRWTRWARARARGRRSTCRCPATRVRASLCTPGQHPPLPLPASLPPACLPACQPALPFHGFQCRGTLPLPCPQRLPRAPGRPPHTLTSLHITCAPRRFLHTTAPQGTRRYWRRMSR